MDKRDIEYIEKTLNKIESKLNTMSVKLEHIDVLSNEIEHVKMQLAGGAPTIKQCDSRGKLLELKVANLEKIVFGVVGVVLTAVVGLALTKLLGE